MLLPEGLLKRRDLTDCSWLIGAIEGALETAVSLLTEPPDAEILNNKARCVWSHYSPGCISQTSISATARRPTAGIRSSFYPDWPRTSKRSPLKPMKRRRAH